MSPLRSIFFVVGVLLLLVGLVTALGESFDVKRGGGPWYVYGYVVDCSTGMYLPGVAVSVGSVSKTTDVTGYYLMYLWPGAYTFSYSRAGYTTQTASVFVDANKNLGTVQLVPSSYGTGCTAPPPPPSPPPPPAPPPDEWIPEPEPGTRTETEDVPFPSTLALAEVSAGVILILLAVAGRRT